MSIENFCKITPKDPKQINPNIISNVIEELLKLKEKDDKTMIIQFIKIFSTLYIIYYCIIENSKYLCLIDNTNNFNFIYIDNNENIFKKILNNDEFPFYMIRHDSSKWGILVKY